MSTTPVRIEDLVPGSGSSPKKGKKLDLHYVLTINGFDGKKIDSSRDRGHPFSYIFDSGQVIKGWDLGVKTMKEGGKRRLIIAPEYGYGSEGIGSVIPPNTTLYFDIELIKVH